MDLVSEKEAQEVKNAIRTMNKKAEIIETTRSVVPLNKIINTGSFKFDEAEKNSQWLVSLT